MNLCLPSGLEPFPSDYLSKISRILKVLCMLQVTFGLFLVLSYYSGGFSMIIEGMILYCTIRYHNLCLSILYILFGLLELIDGVYFTASIVTLYLYDKTQLSSGIGLPMLKTPIFLLSTYYTFLLYRELKASFIENGENANLLVPQSRQQNPERRNFEGQGYRLD